MYNYYKTPEKFLPALPHGRVWNRFSTKSARYQISGSKLQHWLLRNLNSPCNELQRIVISKTSSTIIWYNSFDTTHLIQLIWYNNFWSAHCTAAFNQQGRFTCEWVTNCTDLPLNLLYILRVGAKKQNSHGEIILPPLSLCPRLGFRV